MKPSFHIDINLCVSLTADEIWPDGNAPENPTVADVEALFFKRHNVHQTCADWGLEIRKEDVRITMDSPEVLARLERLQAKLEAERKQKADTGTS